MKMAKLLITADPEAIDRPDNNLWTPLMTTAEFGQAQLTHLLIENGADLELADKNGLRALHWAAVAGQAPAAEALLAFLKKHAGEDDVTYTGCRMGRVVRQNWQHFANLPI